MQISTSGENTARQRQTAGHVAVCDDNGREHGVETINEDQRPSSLAETAEKQKL